MANAKSSRATRTGLKSEVCSASRAYLCAHGMQLTKGSNRHQELRAILSYMLAALFYVYAFKAYRWESAHVYPDSQRQAYILAKEETDLFLCPFQNAKNARRPFLIHRIQESLLRRFPPNQLPNA